MKRKIIKLISLIILLVLIKEIFMILYVNFENKKNILTYYKNETNFNYSTEMLLNIPKIKLETIVKKAADNFDNLDKNLVFYKDIDYNKTIIILGHSGLGYGTYFNRIDELSYSDKLYLSINDKKIEYKFKKRYVINESDVDILNQSERETLILITCKKGNNRKRLIVEFCINNVETLKI